MLVCKHRMSTWQEYLDSPVHVISNASACHVSAISETSAFRPIISQLHNAFQKCYLPGFKSYTTMFSLQLTN